MVDWKTYAKAARNTTRKQAPGARDAAQHAAQRATSRAGGYARAAGKALDRGRSSDGATRPDARRTDDRRADERLSDRSDERRDDLRSDQYHEDQVAGLTREDRPRDGDRTVRTTAKPSAPRTETPSRSLRDEATIYAVVASRTAERAGTRAKNAGIGGRIARAVRDALLIGGSLLVIWGVLYAAGLPIPFTTVLIIVLVIVLIALASGLYAQFARTRQSPEPDHPEG